MHDLFASAAPAGDRRPPARPGSVLRATPQIATSQILRKDLTAMHFNLTEEQAAIQETALTFAKERIAPYASEWDQACHFPVDVIRELAALGMATIYVPEDKGGA